MKKNYRVIHPDLRVSIKMTKEMAITYAEAFDAEIVKITKLPLGKRIDKWLAKRKLNKFYKNLFHAETSHLSHTI